MHDLRLRISMSILSGIDVKISREDEMTCEGCTPALGAVVIPGVDGLERWLKELFISRRESVEAVGGIVSELAVLGAGCPN